MRGPRQVTPSQGDVCVLAGDSICSIPCARRAAGPFTQQQAIEFATEKYFNCPDIADQGAQTLDELAV